MLRFIFNKDDIQVDVTSPQESGAKMARAALYVVVATLLLTVGFWAAVFGPTALQRVGLVVSDTGGDPGSQALTPVGRRTKIDGTLLTDYFVVYEDGEVRDVLTVDTINEYTSAAGVTIDGLTLKDGGIGEDVAVSGDVTAVGVTASGNITGSGDVTLSGADVDITLSADSSGGNAGARNEIQALPRLKMVALGTGTNGSTETTSYMDDTPDGEWSATGVTVTVTADTTYYRVGSKGLKVSFPVTATAGDGITSTIVSDDLTDNESIGFWLYATEAITAGTLEIELDDDDAVTDPTADVPAVDAANQWTWVEVDISDCDGGGTDCNAVTGVNVKLTSGGATAFGAFDVYLDGMYKWDADDEEALSTAILQDGVLSVMGLATAQDQANTQIAQALYTDYFIHYEDGNDFIVWITDESATSNVALVSY